MKYEDKEKQIEEIETIIKSNLAEGRFANTFARKVAIQIVEHYRPELSEDSVVLLKEETERFRGQTINIAKIKSQAHKETAEKFLQLAYDRCLDNSFIKKVEELAKELGIEIKE